MTIYVTYITIYSGNKIPPFYIGYTSKNKILKGYRGSVTSKKYKKIWNEELKSNPHLFKTRVIKEFYNKKDALLHEEKIHVMLNVDKNPLYVNMIKSRHYWTNTGGYKLTDEQKQNRKWSEERKKAQAKITSERNKNVWDSYTKSQKKQRCDNISNSLKGKTAHNKGKPRTDKEKNKISNNTKKAMDNKDLRSHLSKKAKERGIVKICCLECKKVITAPTYKEHMDKHDGIKRIYITDGVTCKKILESDEIPKGWVRGRLKRKK